MRPGARSGVILAGGRSSRIGRPKALLEIAGEPLLRRVARALAPSCDEIVLVAAPEALLSPELREGLAREARRVARLGWRRDGRAHMLRPRVRIVHDPRPHLGPVAGLACGLAAARGEVAFVAACDLPFLAPCLVAALFARAERERADVLLPRWRGYLEPLAGVYRVATMGPHYARQLADGELKPTALLGAVRAREVGERTLRTLDPSACSFLNVNLREDLEAARALAGEAPGATPTGRGRRPARSPRGASAGG